MNTYLKDNDKGCTCYVRGKKTEKKAITSNCKTGQESRQDAKVQAVSYLTSGMRYVFDNHLNRFDMCMICMLTLTF